MLDYIKRNKLGTFTIALSLTYMFLGLPDQILTILRTRSIANISIVMFGLLAAQCISWVLYGFQKRDWFVVTANSVGGGLHAYHRHRVLSVHVSRASRDRARCDRASGLAEVNHRAATRDGCFHFVSGRTFLLYGG